MTSETDRTRAARLAWAVTTLTQAGRQCVTAGRLAAATGIGSAEVLRLATTIGFTVTGDDVTMTWPSGSSRRHVVEVGDRVLDSGRGCSIDVFLLAIATGEPVRARSTCPATGIPIRVELTADTVTRVDPPTAVMATVDLPDVDLTAGLDRIDASICAHQPFFASALAAATWLAEHPGGRIHPIADYLDQAHQLVKTLEKHP